MTFLRLLTLLAVGLIALPTWAQQAPPQPLEHCTVFTPYGFPSSKKQDVTKVCREAYVLEHDNRARIPTWVAYPLTAAGSVGCVKRSDAFAADRSLPVDARAQPKDYAKSGYDIGHLANSADMSWNVEVERQSFIMSNMTPQLPGFNRGIWKVLEDQTRAWALQRDTLLIYTGPIYPSKGQVLVNGRVVVPTAYFKVIVDLETREVLSFIFKHEASKEPLASFVTSLAEVQRQSGLTIPVPAKPILSRVLWKSKAKSVRAAKSQTCAL